MTIEGTSPSVRKATPRDAAALAALVNTAYEVEHFFVAGDRTNADEIAALARDGVMLVLDRPGGGLAAAVMVKAVGGHGFLGMLSVAPGLQGQGLGRRMVAVAEAWCAALGCAEMTLEVVNLRTELEAWYRSLGYRAVGTAPYVHRPALKPCHFVCLAKPLSAGLG
ncbi:MAG: GNAT family N-acetyltransferase [Deltaproteobacteria bacterium]|nr:GNAT family N-acetyltransferase [Deltaproteobacteria bacterium]